MSPRALSRIITYRQDSISAAATLVMLTLAVRALSLVQQALLARQFGVSYQTDAFFVAQVVPMLIGGILGSSLTTVFTREFVAVKSTKVGATLWLVLALTGGVAVAWFLFNPPVVSILGKGSDASTFALATQLSMLMSAMFVLFGLAGVARAYCYSESIFALPTLSDALPYIGGIIGILLGSKLGIGAVAVGFMAGLGLHALVVLAPWLKSPTRERTTPTQVVQLAQTRARPLVRSLVFVTGSLLISQLYFITDRSLASLLGAGWVSVFGFAASLFSLPSQLLVMNMTRAFLPGITALVVEQRWRELGRQVDLLVATTVFVFLPISLLLFLGSVSLTKLLFQGDAFSAQDTLMTAAVVRGYSFGLLGFALKDVATSILVALSRETISFYVGIAGFFINLVLSWLLLPSLGYSGITLVTAGVFTLNAVVLLLVASKHMGTAWLRSLPRSLWRMGLGLAGLTLTYLVFSPEALQVHSSLQLLLELARIGLAGVVYLLICRLLRLRELELLLTHYVRPITLKLKSAWKVS